ncbi:hypothetical protein HPP92_022370 [Vanilla planifolia]|uniref:Uncharacterized protein n=1 Tax=Vanilla planifolia TaxID=51239 RepID=A0A835PXB9_VANPL|nr:hypothetical protein HPP92_022370 [Vanilla planifolia]
MNRRNWQLFHLILLFIYPFVWMAEFMGVAPATSLECSCGSATSSEGALVWNSRWDGWKSTVASMNSPKFMNKASAGTVWSISCQIYVTWKASATYMDEDLSSGKV